MASTKVEIQTEATPPVGRDRPVRDAGESVRELCEEARTLLEQLAPLAVDFLACANAIASRVDDWTTAIDKVVHRRAARGGDTETRRQGD